MKSLGVAIAASISISSNRLGAQTGRSDGVDAAW
jgi:hypothetical protein